MTRGKILLATALAAVVALPAAAQTTVGLEAQFKGYTFEQGLGPKAAQLFIAPLAVRRLQLRWHAHQTPEQPAVQVLPREVVHMVALKMGGEGEHMTHFGGILKQQDALHLPTLLAGGLHVRLHQGFVAHMRILAEPRDGLGPGVTVLLSGDGARWFPRHRSRDLHRSVRPRHLSQLRASKGLLCPLLGR